MKSDSDPRERSNFASQTTRVLTEDRGVQGTIDENEQSEEKRKEEKEESELAGLRVSLIEAKVALEKGALAVEALSQKVRKKEGRPSFLFFLKIRKKFCSLFSSVFIYLT